MSWHTVRHDIEMAVCCYLTDYTWIKWNAINLKRGNRLASCDINFYKAFVQGLNSQGSRIKRGEPGNEARGNKVTPKEPTLTSSLRRVSGLRGGGGGGEPAAIVKVSTDTDRQFSVYIRSVNLVN